MNFKFWLGFISFLSLTTHVSAVGNGSPANWGEYPFVTEVHFSGRLNFENAAGEPIRSALGQSNCSASIISDSTLLTAGHCLDSFADQDSIRFYFSETESERILTDRFRDSAGKKEFLGPRPQQRYFYDRNLYDPDIALIIFEKETFKSEVIAQSGVEPLGTGPITLVGWGGTKQTGPGEWGHCIERVLDRPSKASILQPKSTLLINSMGISTTLNNQRSLYTSAFSCPGDSGGPVISESGKLVAIINGQEQRGLIAVTPLIGPSEVKALARCGEKIGSSALTCFLEKTNSAPKIIFLKIKLVPQDPKKLIFVPAKKAEPAPELPEFGKRPRSPAVAQPSTYLPYPDYELKSFEGGFFLKIKVKGPNGGALTKRFFPEEGKDYWKTGSDTYEFSEEYLQKMQDEYKIYMAPGHYKI